MNLEGFQNFFVQLSNHAFSKPRYGLSHMAPAALAQRLLDTFAESAKRRGELAFAKAQTQGEGSDLARELSKKLERDPGFMLPAGYKRVSQRKVEDDFTIRGEYISEQIKIALEITDSLVAAATGSHIVEPIARYSEVYKAVPTLAAPKRSSVDVGLGLSPRTPGSLQSRGESFDSCCRDEARMGVKSPARVSVVEVQLSPAEVRAKFTPGMKLAIACAPEEDRPTVRETAEIMGEILDAVEKGRKHIGFRVKFAGSKTPSNRLVLQKLKEQKEEDEKRQLTERKRQSRALKIKRVLKENASARDLRVSERERQK